MKSLILLFLVVLVAVPMWLYAPVELKVNVKFFLRRVLPLALIIILLICVAVVVFSLFPIKLF